MLSISCFIFLAVTASRALLAGQRKNERDANLIPTARKEVQSTLQHPSASAREGIMNVGSNV